jgi:DNA-directed RNA polymerase subunit alpha
MIANYTHNFPNIKSNLKQTDEQNYTLTIEPLLPGFGYTLGNSLRRILLSSIPGFAVTRVSINDITHEYQAIEQVTEDAFDIVLNLKSLRVKINTDEEKVTLKINKDKPGAVTAADFAKDSRVEVINPNLYICNLDKSGKLEIEVDVSRGVGYLSMEDINLAANPNPKHILVDALFSPVTNVSLEVDKVRVGEKTNYDKISIKFSTQENVSGQEIVDYALKLTTDLFAKIHSSLQATADFSEAVESPASAVKTPKAQEMKVGAQEEINLPTKVKNILAKNGINTNSELIARADEVEDFNGVAEKTLQNIKDYIKTIS